MFYAVCTLFLFVVWVHHAYYTILYIFIYFYGSGIFTALVVVSLDFSNENDFFF